MIILLELISSRNDKSLTHFVLPLSLKHNNTTASGLQEKQTQPDISYHCEIKESHFFTKRSLQSGHFYKQKRWPVGWPDCAFGILQYCSCKQLCDSHQTDTIHLHYLVIHLYARGTEDSHEIFSKHFHCRVTYLFQDRGKYFRHFYEWPQFIY